MESYHIRWPEAGDGSLLLLVAVDGRLDGPEQTVPCRVVGRFDPGQPYLPPRESVPEQAARLLMTIGMPVNLRGCQYLRTALVLALERPELLRSLNRRLYPAIAREHGATVQAIERAIRHAIAQTWARGGGERCRQLLGRAFSCVGDRPSNGELLALLADHLAMGRR